MKCRYCGVDITANNLIQDPKRKGYYYCSQDHLDKYNVKLEQGMESKQKAEHIMTDREKIIDYMYLKFPKDQINFAVISKQIKDFVSNYHYKESGILLTLKYCYDTMEMPLDKNIGIGIVPYYYEEAKEQYVHKWKIAQQAEKMEKVEPKIIEPSDTDMNLVKYKLRRKKNEIT